MFGFGENKQQQCVCNEQNVDKQLKKEEVQQQEKSEKKDDLVEKMAICTHELATLKDTYLRLVADFQNYKKRAEIERIDRAERVKTDLLLEMLHIVDNFDRALDETNRMPNEQLQQWIAGFELIRKIFYDFLKQQGVEPMTEYAMFDPVYHEAISSIESPGNQTGTILTVFEKGFLYKEKVLRTAKVSVSQ